MRGSHPTPLLVRTVGNSLHQHQPRVAENDAIPAKTVATVGNDQREVTTPVIEIDADSRLLVRHHAFAAEARLTVHKDPHVALADFFLRPPIGRIAGGRNEPRDFALRIRPADCRQIERGLSAGLAEENLIPRLACMNNTECQGAE